MSESPGSNGDEMPIVREIHQNGKLRYLPHLRRDTRGRIREAFGRIPLDDDSVEIPSRRARVPDDIRTTVMQWADRINGTVVDDIGHIIPFKLNGADHAENFYPQNATANRLMGSIQERWMSLSRRDVLSMIMRRSVAQAAPSNITNEAIGMGIMRVSTVSSRTRPKPKKAQLRYIERSEPPLNNFATTFEGLWRRARLHSIKV
ncbi:unnamed protein product, partial [Mesorhabditis belari]|uniref:HNH endonuclease n=1 Tax=Mesorhabditis belari TaxID=2138241 RepID=A0AAF3EN64_9BILA